VSIIVELRFLSFQSCPKNEQGDAITAFTSTPSQHRGFEELLPKSQQLQQDGDPYPIYIFRLQLSLSSSPMPNTIYLGMFDSPATVTNLFSSLLAYYLTISTQLSQESDTQ